MLPVLVRLDSAGCPHLRECGMGFLGSKNRTMFSLAVFYPRQESKGKMSETNVGCLSFNFISC